MGLAHSDPVDTPSVNRCVSVTRAMMMPSSGPCPDVMASSCPQRSLPRVRCVSAAGRVAALPVQPEGEGACTW